MIIKELFDPNKPINRRIEKVITYELADPELLKREIREYVVTDSIADSLEKLLDLLDAGMSGDDVREVGVWVAGFYGSGKSSLTKYLGFALDPTKSIDGQPFLAHLQAQIRSLSLRQRLATVVKRRPATVVMLDLASEQLAGASMAEISSVLYWKVMQWAGYSRDRKVAYLEFMLEKDGRLDEFRRRVCVVADGTPWEEIHNQPLLIKSVASQVASEFYPKVWPDARAFNEIRIGADLAEKMDDAVRDMLGLIRRRGGTENVLFILDEVGQYIAHRDELILNLDGLAKNIKNIGRGHAWLIATAQQTLTEDDPGARLNTVNLYKLKDRFPISIDLEASDIKEICWNRLLSKSPEGSRLLAERFETSGPTLQFATALKDAKYYKSTLDKDSFCKFYPFLPHHFDILLPLLGRLARTSGGVGLRSAIKVIQDVLVEVSRPGQAALGDQPVGSLANCAIFYDILRRDIEKSFRYVIEAVTKVDVGYGADSAESRAAKAIAIVQILEDLPCTRENIAALLHPSINSTPLLQEVSGAVQNLLDDKAIPLQEVDGNLRFLSEAVTVLEQEKGGINVRAADVNSIRNAAVRAVFTPEPVARLLNVRNVNAGLKIQAGPIAVSLFGPQEPLQVQLDLVPDSQYEARKADRIAESQHNKQTIFLLAHDSKDLEEMAAEAFRCQTIYNQNRGRSGDKEVDQYLRAQDQRAKNLAGDLERRLAKAFLGGSFIFRGELRAVSEFAPDFPEAMRKQLSRAAERVFDKFEQAPLQAESALAERFIKTERFDRILSRDDPLGVVKPGGAINVSHPALSSIREYLEQKGSVDGKRLLDDFFAPPFGWSKDTSRYLVAALLAAGEIKLRIAGEDVAVRGPVAIDHLKNTNNFNKIGIALRAAQTTAEEKLRAANRLIELTGENVLPLEDDISKAVMKHLPDLGKAYGPLATKLGYLALAGVDRAEAIQDSISEILKGDASDAASRLGGDQCPLFDDLLWARAANRAFENGAEAIVQECRQVLHGLNQLPDHGTLQLLKTDTQLVREDLEAHLASETFFDSLVLLQQRLADIKVHVGRCAADFSRECAESVAKHKHQITGLAEWAEIGQEEQARLKNELDQLSVAEAKDLDGIRRILNANWRLTAELDRIEGEVRNFVPPPPPPADDVVVQIRKRILTTAELDRAVETLQSVRQQLEAGKPVSIEWEGN